MPVQVQWRWITAGWWSLCPHSILKALQELQLPWQKEKVSQPAKATKETHDAWMETHHQLWVQKCPAWNLLVFQTTVRPVLTAGKAQTSFIA